MEPSVISGGECKAFWHKTCIAGMKDEENGKGLSLYADVKTNRLKEKKKQCCVFAARSVRTGLLEGRLRRLIFHSVIRDNIYITFTQTKSPSMTHRLYLEMQSSRLILASVQVLSGDLSHMLVRY